MDSFGCDEGTDQQCNPVRILVLPETMNELDLDRVTDIFVEMFPELE